jgi:3-oxoacyl-[acyl-carrier protein] reductase
MTPSGSATSARPLDGRVAIITGAARNIGAGIAESLAGEGAATVINYRSETSGPEADALVARIQAAGGCAAAFRADVGNESDVAALVAAAREMFGPPDVLVNNAAVSVAAVRPWTEIAVEEWDATLRTNVTAGFLCAREVLPSMRERGGGSVVNISSVRVLLGRAGILDYTTSKAAQIGFTRALSREVGAIGIRVNAVIVGAIETPDEAVYGDPAELADHLGSVQALPRRGIPSDVGGAVAFLCRDEASFITGQSLVVDGGWAMQ